ncbi:putative phage-associated protein [Desulfomicrobium macestii]|uniref:Phage-associated protein n=1 Tax=Desulfomicrobium macestii TaxID=90731 RepID=A0ABR9H8Q4_9BACT|nr:Panacea domain-containing protein [Desulfomicrobium macestii]MBE1427077.1 putative phage-associated protein [Desulfomicrobium macestii]
MKIRYRANPRKLLEALVLIAENCPDSYYHFILKTLFYADKFHLQKYRRPVTGDVYVKMSYGPVPSLAYDMLKQNENLPAQVLDEVQAALDVHKFGRYPAVSAKRLPNLNLFSGTDIECLKEALSSCSPMGFEALTNLTHRERAWEEAEMNQEMNFELFIDEDLPNREELIEYIKETSPCLAL